MAWVIGVDVGGTFTDFYAVDTDSRTSFIHKTASTPDQPARAIVDGLQVLCAQHNIDLRAIDRLSHGTTVATNALLQRRGPRLALITTEGFRDLLEIGRQTRPHMFSLQEDYPTPLVPRELRFEVHERVTADGSILHALNPTSLQQVVAQVRDAEIAACAVCLLFSFVNPAHEREIAAALSSIPNLYVSLSSDVQPEFREYERLSTTVLNAYLQPVIADYLHHLERDISQAVPGVSIDINQSSGGLMSVDRARRFPIRTALSGPAAGAVGAIYTAQLSGYPNIITLDMGGTSADVALIRNYKTDTSFNRDVGGFPVRLPMVDINTVGAGGGSVAWFDRDGLLKVGPLSAGASPGPACYMAGGDQPTVTDANLLLGRLAPQGLLGGRVPLNAEAARRVFIPLADRIGFSCERTAHGVLGIVVSNMVRAIRSISVERGHDPRDFALMPFGGAGPLHAGAVARSLGIRTIVVPPAPGILCAQGLIVSDVKEDFVRTARTRVELGQMGLIQCYIQELIDRSDAWREAEGLQAEQFHRHVTVDMRYVGQNFELSVPLHDAVLDETIPADIVKQLHHLFFAAHEQQYGYFNPDDPVEIMNFRLTARGRLHNQPQAHKVTSEPQPTPLPIGARDVYFDAETALTTPVYDRATLTPGQIIQGQAVIDQLDATTLLYPGDQLRVDAALNLCIEVSP